MTLPPRGTQRSEHQDSPGLSPTRTLRCAVYTRKSSEEGLDQAFNSLDAQREAGADFIKSQRHQGWVQVKDAYDDGGFSGGSMQRPGLQRLLDDIKAGRVDVVVVYKVDRLSRSLADFARLMQLFDERGVSFVSVTQQFNTTTSMGRLTLNMLLSFAQFEREVAGERIRDKIAATKRKGVWVTGQPPLGYRVPRESDKDYTPGDRTLRIVESEAALVRSIFAAYAKHTSLLAVARELNASGHRTRRWTSTRGVTHGGKPLTAHYVHSVLSNPVYIGKITHKRPPSSARCHGAGRSSQRHMSDIQVYDGLHEPIIDQSTWDGVHEQMLKSQRSHRERTAWSGTHLLKGKLFTSAGSIMSPSSVQRPTTKRRDHAVSDRKRVILYYVSQQAIKHGYATCPIKSVNAQVLDAFVRDAVCAEVKHRTRLDLWSRDAAERDNTIREATRCVTVGVDTLTITLDREKLHSSSRDSIPRADAAVRSEVPTSMGASEPTPRVTEDESTITLTFALNIKHFDGRRVILSNNGTLATGRTAPTDKHHPAEHIRLALGLAFAWRDILLRRNITIADLAREHGLAEGRVHLLLTLTQLSPKAIKAALTGTLDPSLSLEQTLQIARVIQWRNQHEQMGGPHGGLDRQSDHNPIMYRLSIADLTVEAT